MSLEIVKPEEPKQFITTKRDMTPKELLVDKIKEIHKDNLSWLESKSFKQSYTDQNNRYVAYKTSTNYGDIFIDLFRDGEVSATLCIKDNMFFAQEQFDQMKDKLEEKCTHAVNAFERELNDIESTIEIEQHNMQKKLQSVLPPNIKVYIPFSAEVCDCDGEHIGLTDINISFDNEYEIKAGKANITAKEAYEKISKVIELLESK